VFMKIRTIIVDDEFMGRETLSGLIQAYCPGIELVAEASDIAQAKELILSLSPDLVLLDINMPGGSGFDLLKSLDKISFELIFVTSYNQFALQAIKSCALDYLLKPVNIKELQEAMEKVRVRMSQNISESNIKMLL
jgi:two-component system, LytTR family, response regulator